MKDLIFIRDCKDKSILLTWNLYPKKGTNYYEHQIALTEKLKELISKYPSAIQLRAGKSCFATLKALPPVGINIVPCVDVSKKDCELFYV